jgi:DNA polymerase-3 subunit epsilon
MKIAILDTETQGLDASQHKCIEVAVMLFDLAYAQPVASFASLIRSNSNEAVHINGIPSEMLAHAHDPDIVWRNVRWLIEPAQAIVAHRAEFDQQFCPPLDRPWVCSKTDLRIPGHRMGDSLVQLALSLGLGVASAHRAMADVDTLARILTRVSEMGHDLEEMFVLAMRPKKRFVAVVSYEMRQAAKDAGFLWDGDRRQWWRMMPPEDAEALSFRVEQRDA